MKLRSIERYHSVVPTTDDNYTYTIVPIHLFHNKFNINVTYFQENLFFQEYSLFLR